MKKRVVFPILALVVACLVITPGCVSKSVYQDLEAKVAQLEKEVGQSQDKELNEELNKEFRASVEELRLSMNSLQKETRAWREGQDELQRQLASDVADDVSALKNDLAPIVDSISQTRADLQSLAEQASRSSIDIVSLYDKCSKSVVGIEFEEQVQGAGFVYSTHHIITVEYVIREAPQIVKVILYDDTILDAELIGSDEKSGVAVLWVEEELPVSPLPLGDASAVKVGEPILVIGNPGEHVRVAISGIIGQKDVTATFSEKRSGIQHNVKYSELLEFDNAAGGGSSGGPLLNSKGEVLGMVKGGHIGVTGFAIPSDMIKQVISSLSSKYLIE
ncbi:trypsin-like peptidase domain-containing protein [Chloroflexota bacterium]